MQTNSYIKKYLTDEKSRKQKIKKYAIIIFIVLVCIFNPVSKLRTTIYSNAEKLREQNAKKVFTNPFAKEYDAPITEFFLSKRYGEQIKIDTNKKEFHTGVDLLVKKDTYVEVIEKGTVVFSGNDEKLGNVIIVEHITDKETFYTVYGNLSANYTYTGQQLDKRAIIGELVLKEDNSDFSNYPILHFETRMTKEEGTSVDPKKYIDYSLGAKGNLCT